MTEKTNHIDIREGADLSTLKKSDSIGRGQVMMHLIILIICAGAFCLTYFFEEVPEPLRRGMAPESFPRGVALLAFVLTIISFIRTMPCIPTEKNLKLPTTFYLSIVGCLLFLVIANFIDLLIAMALFIAAISWLWGEHRKWVIIALSFVLPFVIFILFSEMLGIRFPRGLLVNLIYN